MHSSMRVVVSYIRADGGFSCCEAIEVVMGRWGASRKKKETQSNELYLENSGVMSTRR
jgi:hypothetical protein